MKETRPNFKIVRPEDHEHDRFFVLYTTQKPGVVVDVCVSWDDDEAYDLLAAGYTLEAIVETLDEALELVCEIGDRYGEGEWE